MSRFLIRSFQVPLRLTYVAYCVPLWVINQWVKWLTLPKAPLRAVHTAATRTKTMILRRRTGEEETWLCMEMEHTYGCALFAVFFSGVAAAAPAASPRQFHEWRVRIANLSHMRAYMVWLYYIFFFSLVDFSRFVSFFFVKIEAVYFCIWQWNFTFFSLLLPLLLLYFLLHTDNISTSFKKHIVYLRMHVC